MDKSEAIVDKSESKTTEIDIQVEPVQSTLTEDEDDEEVSDKVTNDDHLKSNSSIEKDRSDHEDPIPSGTGLVSKDCSASDLIGWSEILPKWHSRLHQRPRGLDALVRNGIPEPLRGEVWQLLSGAHQHQNLMDKYRILLTKQAPSEQIILCDVHRTYPAHKNFRSDSSESDSLIEPLYKVCKAYAIYDEEVGYCQGLSFLVAALLLHMPEEQAFCVFVRIMEDYGLRNLFRRKFDELYLKFFQLEQLIQDQIPDLHEHFKRLGLKPYTYASQWFLTVFTAKFPLNAVFHIMDIFLLEGMNTVFQIAVALLKLSKHELLAADFEGVFKLFRVGMPKRYMDQEKLMELISVASNVNIKKLNKYSRTYEIIKQKERMLANATETKSYQAIVSNLEDEKTRLEVEINQLKEVCRRELQRAETESQRDSNIISGYKQICTQQSKRLDAKIEYVKKFVNDIDNLLVDKVKDNEFMGKIYETFKIKVDRLFVKLETDEEQDVIYNNNSDERNNIDIGAIIDTASHIDNQQCDTSPEGSSSQKSKAKPIGAFVKSPSDEIHSQDLLNHIDQLELVLARTKLALVEAECKCQQLSHELIAKTTSSSSSTTPIAGRLSFSKINSILGEKLSMISGPYVDSLIASTQATQSSNSDPESPTHLAKSLQEQTDKIIKNNNIVSNISHKNNNNNINYNKQSDDQHIGPHC